MWVQFQFLVVCFLMLLLLLLWTNRYKVFMLYVYSWRPLHTHTHTHYPCDVTSVPKSESKHEKEKKTHELKQKRNVNYTVQWILYVMWSDHEYTQIHRYTHAYNIIIDTNCVVIAIERVKKTNCILVWMVENVMIIKYLNSVYDIPPFHSIEKFNWFVMCVCVCVCVVVIYLCHMSTWNQHESTIIAHVKSQ